MVFAFNRVILAIVRIFFLLFALSTSAVASAPFLRIIDFLDSLDESYIAQLHADLQYVRSLDKAAPASFFPISSDPRYYCAWPEFETHTTPNSLPYVDLKNIQFKLFEPTPITSTVFDPRARLHQPQNWLLLSINSDRKNEYSLIHEDKKHHDYCLFIREIMPVPNGYQFKRLMTLQTQKPSGMTLCPVTHKWLCYCITRGKYELCVGFWEDDHAWEKIARGHIGMGFPYVNVSQQPYIQSPESKVLKHVEGSLSQIQLVCPKETISTGVCIGHAERNAYLEVLGTGQFSVVYRICNVDQGNHFKDIAWKRISDFQYEEAERFIIQQKISHRLFHDFGVKTEDTAYFIVPAPQFNRQNLYSVHMAQRVIPEGNFADSYLARYPEGDPGYSIKQLEYKRSDGTYAPFELTAEMSVTCIFKRVLELAITNLRTAVSPQSSKRPVIAQCCDCKPDNFVIKFNVRDLKRPYTNDAEPCATAELFDTHPNTLQVHGIPLYESEPFGKALNILLGQDPYYGFRDSIQRLSNLKLIAIRNLDGLLGHGYNREQMLEMVDWVKAFILHQSADNAPIPSCDIEKITLDEVFNYHKGANKKLSAIKLRCAVLVKAYQDFSKTEQVMINRPGSGLVIESLTTPPACLPISTAMIPLSPAQADWIKRIESTPEYGLLVTLIHNRIIELEQWGTNSGTSFPATKALNDQIELIEKNYPFSDNTICYGSQDAYQPPAVVDNIPLSSSQPMEIDQKPIERKRSPLSQSSSSYSDGGCFSCSPLQIFSPPRKFSVTTHSLTQRLRKGESFILAIDNESSDDNSDNLLHQTPYNDPHATYKNIEKRKKYYISKMEDFMRQCTYGVQFKSREKRKLTKTTPHEVICNGLLSNKTWASQRRLITDALQSQKSGYVLKLPGHSLPYIGKEHLTSEELFRTIARLPDTRQHPIFIKRERLLMGLIAVISPPDTKLYVLDFTPTFINSSTKPTIILMEHIAPKMPGSTHLKACNIEFDELGQHLTQSAHFFARIYVQEPKEKTPFEIWLPISEITDNATMHFTPSVPAQDQSPSVFTAGTGFHLHQFARVKREHSSTVSSSDEEMETNVYAPAKKNAPHYYVPQDDPVRNLFNIIYSMLRKLDNGETIRFFSDYLIQALNHWIQEEAGQVTAVSLALIHGKEYKSQPKCYKLVSHMMDPLNTLTQPVGQSFCKWPHALHNISTPAAFIHTFSSPANASLGAKRLTSQCIETAGILCPPAISTDHGILIAEMLKLFLNETSSPTILMLSKLIPSVTHPRITAISCNNSNHHLCILAKWLERIGIALHENEKPCFFQLDIPISPEWQTVLVPVSSHTKPCGLELWYSDQLYSVLNRGRKFKSFPSPLNDQAQESKSCVICSDCYSVPAVMNPLKIKIESLFPETQ